MKKTPEDILIAIGNISNITNPLMAEKTVANILKKTNQLKDSHIIIQLFCKLVEMLKKTKRRESHYHFIKESFPMMYELLYKRPTIRNLEYDFNLLLISRSD